MVDPGDLVWRGEMINARYRPVGAVAGQVSEVVPPAYRRSGRPFGGRVVVLEPRPLAGGSSTRGPSVFAKRQLPDRDGELGPIARFRAAQGTLVAEVDLTCGRDYAVDALIGHARALCADKLWVHAHVIDAEFGFTRCGSCTRPHEGGARVGICEVNREAQWIDVYGGVPWLRTPDRYARLVRGATARVRNKPIALETCGDAASTLEAYSGLGLEVAHAVSGWVLDLREQ
jgi:hypothetical protein